MIRSLKKGRAIILMTLAMFLTAAQPVFAWDPSEGPAPNDNFMNAWIIHQGESIQGYIGEDDVDWYVFSTSKTAPQIIHFFPPDNQFYHVVVYDGYDIWSGLASPIAVKVYSQGPGVVDPIIFDAQVGRTYYILVMGQVNLTTPYTLLVAGQP